MSDKSKISEWVDAAKQGDEAAMTELIHYLEKPLFRFLFHLSGSEPLAQDLCQEALVKVMTKISQLRDGAGVQSWAFQLARNLFIDEMRKDKTRGENEESNEEQTSDSIPEDVLTVRSVLEKLDVAEREVLILIDMEGHSYQEAAKILDTTEAAVRSRLHRARSTFLNDFETLDKKVS